MALVAAAAVAVVARSRGSGGGNGVVTAPCWRGGPVSRGGPTRRATTAGSTPGAGTRSGEASCPGAERDDRDLRSASDAGLRVLVPRQRAKRYPFLRRYAVHALALPARLPWTHLSAERTRDRAAALVGGQDIELESDEFNRAYRVRSDDHRFASDLLNPRTMELLLRCGGPDVRIGAGYIVLVNHGPVDPTSVYGALTVLAAMLENLPDFVWSDRGARAPRTWEGGAS